jgi:hypothetical protein
MGRKGKKTRVSRQEEEEIESEVDEEMESEVEEEEQQEHMTQSSANEKSLYEVMKHLHLAWLVNDVLALYLTLDQWFFFLSLFLKILIWVFLGFCFICALVAVWLKFY